MDIASLFYGNLAKGNLKVIKRGLNEYQFPPSKIESFINGKTKLINNGNMGSMRMVDADAEYFNKLTLDILENIVSDYEDEDEDILQEKSLNGMGKLMFYKDYSFREKVRVLESCDAFEIFMFAILGSDSFRSYLKRYFNGILQECFKLHNYPFLKFLDSNLDFNFIDGDGFQQYTYVANPKGNRYSEYTETNISSCIFPDGTIINTGSRNHNNFLSRLKDFGFLYSNYWSDNKNIVHVSFGAYDFVTRAIHPKTIMCTPEQLKSVASYPKMCCYSDNEVSILDEYLKLYDNGAKYANLKFLHDQFTGINLPQIQTEKPKDLTGWCLRSSPKKSMAGILNSYFELDNSTEDKMKEDFEKLNFIEDNELGYFYQRYIEGITGVCHYQNGEITCEISENKGDIVNGKVGSDYDLRGTEIHNLCEKLARYFDLHDSIKYNKAKTKIQLEICIDDEGQRWVLQFRILKAPDNSKDILQYLPKDAKYQGKAFSPADVMLDKEEVLITNNPELMPKELLGYKGLIMVGGQEFCHTLALSTSLGIPSMQMDSIPDLPERFQFNTLIKTGYIR